MKIHLAWPSVIAPYFKSVACCGLKPSTVARVGGLVLVEAEFVRRLFCGGDVCQRCKASYDRAVSSRRAVAMLPHIPSFNSLPPHRRALIERARHES